MKPLHEMIEPPDKIGLNRFLTVPPIWNRGIMIRHSSLGVIVHKEMMQPIPIIVIFSEYGPIF